jgi:hypothetical protein
MPRKTTKRARFPKDLLVRWDWDGETPYLTVLENGLASVDEEQDVAVYRLEEVRALKITKELVK